MNIICVGKDESKNLIDVNVILSTVESNQWSFDRTQTSIMSKRNEDSKILKSLNLSKVERAMSASSMISLMVNNFISDIFLHSSLISKEC